MYEYFEIRVYLNKPAQGESRKLVGTYRIETFPDDETISSKVNEFNGDYAIVERHYENLPFA